MRAVPHWQGVRMRRVELGADPDAPPRRLTIPAAWEDAAAAGLAALVPVTRPADLRAAADAWIRPVAERGCHAGLDADLNGRLHRLLLQRRGAPMAEIWQSADVGSPGFVLNLAAFHEAGAGFAAAEFAAAVDIAVTCLTLFQPSAQCIGVRLADLDGLLAALGLSYDSMEARRVAAAIAGLLRGSADLASAKMTALFGRSAAGRASAPTVPARCLVPGLSEAAERALAEAEAQAALYHVATTCIGESGPAEALLGVETGGIAPAFAMVRDGRLTNAARARLAAHGMSAEAALAALLGGEDPLPIAGIAAHAAMHNAVAPWLHAMPERPAMPIAPVWQPTAPTPRRPAHTARSPAPLLPLELPRLRRLPVRGRPSAAAARCPPEGREQRLC